MISRVPTKELWKDCSAIVEGMWPPECTSSYKIFCFWCQFVDYVTTTKSKWSECKMLILNAKDVPQHCKPSSNAFVAVALIFKVITERGHPAAVTVSKVMRMWFNKLPVVKDFERGQRREDREWLQFESGYVVIAENYLLYAKRRMCLSIQWVM